MYQCACLQNNQTGLYLTRASVVHVKACQHMFCLTLLCSINKYLLFCFDTCFLCTTCLVSYLCEMIRLRESWRSLLLCEVPVYVFCERVVGLEFQFNTVLYNTLVSCDSKRFSLADSYWSNTLFQYWVT